MIKSILNDARIYNLWQLPFYSKKMAPFLEKINSSHDVTILELGCGPATNVHLLDGVRRYIGVDYETKYIEYARDKYPSREFLCADVLNFNFSDLKIEGEIHLLINSLFHHLNDEIIKEIFLNIAKASFRFNSINIIDMILPERPSISKFLAENDRGKFPRKEDDFKKLLNNLMNIDQVQRFDLKFLKITCWQMIYFIGTQR